MDPAGPQRRLNTQVSDPLRGTNQEEIRHIGGGDNQEGQGDENQPKNGDPLPGLSPSPGIGVHLQPSSTEGGLPHRVSLKPPPRELRGSLIQ